MTIINIKHCPSLPLFTILILLSSIGCTVGSLKINPTNSANQLNGNLVEHIVNNETSVEILQRLRSFMKIYEIETYLIPSNDAHQSEFVAMSDRRLEYISRFTGSVGFAIVTTNKAAIWIDSRYYLQAEHQVDAESFEIMKQGLKDVPSKTEWLKSVIEPNSSVGFDPLLLSSTEAQSFIDSLKGEHEVKSIDQNLIDLVWKEKPSPNITPLMPQLLKYTGRTVLDKVEYIKSELEKQNAEAVFLSALDDIAWLFNLRAHDIQYTPVFYAYAILSRNEGLHLFIHDNRITPDIEKHFTDEGINNILHVHNYHDVVNGTKNYIEKSNGNIVIPVSLNYAIYSAIPEKRMIKKNLVSILKSVKTEAEVEGMRNCHVRDGAALVRYMRWLEENIDKENITELSGANKLTQFRSEQELFVSPSFTPISAVGPNAAMAHYSPSESTDRQITKNEVYLLDSGGQYLDGTIDTTRTIHLGTPSDFEKECFTRVMKGYIAVHSSIFPNGASDTYFDAIARQYLWEIGLDYGHGTGHGVGSFLAVHEYPPSFSYRSDPTYPGLVQNMFTSVEPGVYIDEKFGIRIEDVIRVAPVEVRYDFAGKGAMKYESITLVPLQTKLMDMQLLTNNEIEWINDYHKKVLNKVGVLLKEQGLDSDYDWLKQQTKPIKIKT